MRVESVPEHRFQTALVAFPLPAGPPLGGLDAVRPANRHPQCSPLH